MTPLLLETPLMVQFIEPPPLPPVVIEEPPKALSMAAPPIKPPIAPKKPVTPKRLPAPPKKVDTPPAPPSMSALETTASEEPASDAVPVTSEAVASEPASSRDTGAASSNGDAGNSVGARFDADFLNNPKPPYPPYSRRLGEEGKVILRVLVSAEGKAQEVELHTSSGSRRLDDSALRTVHVWKFVPAKRAGVAVESRALVPILFKLEQ